MIKAKILIAYCHITAIFVFFARINTSFRKQNTSIIVHILLAEINSKTWGRTRIFGFVFTALDFCSLLVETTDATGTFVFAIAAWNRSSELKWEEQ